MWLTVQNNRIQNPVLQSVLYKESGRQKSLNVFFVVFVCFETHSRQLLHLYWWTAMALWLQLLQGSKNIFSFPYSSNQGVECFLILLIFLVASTSPCCVPQAYSSSTGGSFIKDSSSKLTCVQFCFMLRLWLMKTLFVRNKYLLL